MDRILVAYGSKHGSTREIAARIAGTLRDAGYDVDLRRACEVGSLDGYDGVVLGSAVYMKHWRRDAARLLARRELADKALWLFSSGPAGEMELDMAKLVSEHVLIRGRRLGARDHALFGGRLSTTDSGFIGRAIAGKVEPEQRDLRDWDAIDSWALGIAAALRGERRVMRAL